MSAGNGIFQNSFLTPWASACTLEKILLDRASKVFFFSCFNLSTLYRAWLRLTIRAQKQVLCLFACIDAVPVHASGPQKYFSDSDREPLHHTQKILEPFQRLTLLSTTQKHVSAWSELAPPQIKCSTIPQLVLKPSHHRRRSQVLKSVSAFQNKYQATQEMTHSCYYRASHWCSWMKWTKTGREAWAAFQWYFQFRHNRSVCSITCEAAIRATHILQDLPHQ